MNPAWGQVAGVVTVVLMVLFVAIWIWAWRPRHLPKFDALARLPMADRPAANAGDEQEAR